MILVLRIKWFILRVLWKDYCHKFEVYCCLMCNWKEHHRAYAISNETTKIWIWCSDSEKRFKEEKIVAEEDICMLENVIFKTVEV